MKSKMPSDKLNKISIDVGVMLSEMTDLKADIKIINDKLNASYATKEWVELQFGQTRKIVQGMVGVILLAVLGAIVALVVR